MENSPEFLEPQPADTKNLKSFPNKLRGNYQFEDDEILSISKYMIIQSGEEKVSVPLTEIDTSAELFIRNDTLYEKDDTKGVFVEVTNDTAFGSYLWIDTAFTLSNVNILRKIKGNYLLNEKQENKPTWKVVKMQLLKNRDLVFSTIDMKQEIDAIERCTHLINPQVKNDTITNFSLQPSKKEFLLMLESDSIFTDKQVYKMVK
jgi:hypothetical protein